MKRVYEKLVEQHFKENKQMLLLTGPRQVGKTTIALACKTQTDKLIYLNWDNQDHQELILSGPSAIVENSKLQQQHHKKPIIIFDEIHKYPKWKNFLKGFFDTYQPLVNIIVTGSAKLDTYKHGADSMMGRYFLYRINPLSVAELINPELKPNLISPPKKISKEKFSALVNFGGFPEPFIKHDKAFSKRWMQMRDQQLFREDIRDLSQIQHMAQLEILARFLKDQTGQLVSYQSLASKVRVSLETTRKWISTLEQFYYCFTIQPWSKNIARSLLKQPKIYLWDWSPIKNEGARYENLVASHLHKATQFWNDCGKGDFGLYYLRDKEKREVDFLVTKDNNPWFIVEVKSSQNQSLSPSLAHFQKQSHAPHAFQLCFDLNQTSESAFEHNLPIKISAQSFLSQLI